MRLVKGFKVTKLIYLYKYKEGEIMNHVMLDLETFGTDSNAVIVQICACYFDEKTGEIGDTFLRNIDAADCEKYGLTCNASTVYWWLQQNKIVSKGLLINPQPLKESLVLLLEFLDGAAYIWQHSSFDCPILNNAIKKVGINNNIFYRVWKDLRSAEYCLNIDKDKFQFEGLQHNALSDCKFQIKYLVDGLKRRNNE